MGPEGPEEPWEKKRRNTLNRVQMSRNGTSKHFFDGMSLFQQENLAPWHSLCLTDATSLLFDYNAHLNVGCHSKPSIE
jgi:hypothetical protein